MIAKAIYRLQKQSREGPPPRGGGDGGEGEGEGCKRSGEYTPPSTGGEGGGGVDLQVGAHLLTPIHTVLPEVRFGF